MNGLKQTLHRQTFTMLPGIYDCMSAQAAEQAGFPALYFSGGAFSMAQLGRPDMGFFGLTDLLIALQRVLACVNVPVITDADNAFGNAIHAANTAKMLESIGVAGIQMDDDVLPQEKPGRAKFPLSWELLAPKIRAARQSVSSDFVIILRCMLAKTDGIDAAIRRANQAVDLGVDYVYFDGITSESDLEKIADGCKVGKMINLNEQTFSATLPPEKIQEYGFTVGLYPVSSIQAAAKAYDRLFAHLALTGSTMPLRENMVMSGELLDRMGMTRLTEQYLPLYQ